MRYLTILFFLGLSISSMAATIKGYIYDNEGSPLPYTTIYVKETGTGTVSNAEAYYELRLPPGEYTLVYQFIGYTSVEKEVTLGEEIMEVNVSLQPETLVLREVAVKAGKEDPAYAIMRRAIAKAGFHINQIDTFSAKVYIKGTGQVKEIPFFLRKTMEKEGLDTSKLFISESVNEISFRRPNVYKERVISIRSSGDDNNTNPNAYIFTSFYQPEIAKTISPLSPKAFAYYRFEYEGTFEDQGREVSRIKVIPRSKGDNVFFGRLNIVEDLWSIHSLDLSGYKLGIRFDINQIYAPVEEGIWLPVTHKIEFHGTILGFEFEYKYLASVSDYFIVKNPDLDFQLTVIDEKSQPDEADEVKENLKSEEVQKLEELIATKEVNRKQLKKLVKEYEKIEKESVETPEIVRYSYFSVDSTAYRMDSSYWESIRPIPLNSKEKISYEEIDSVAVVEKAKSEGDTLKVSKGKRGFDLKDIITGGSYRIGDKAYFSILNPLKSLQFNTVEGVAFDYGISLSKTFGENNTFIKFTPLARYAFSREVLSGRGTLQFSVGPNKRRNDFTIAGGRYIRQFNRDEPISPLVNSLMTLLLERNYMKIYEHDFLNISYRRRINDHLNVEVSGEWSERMQLENNSDYKVINRDDISGFTSNQPENLALETTAFPTHQAYIGHLTLNYEPWIKYTVRNGRKSKVDDSSPKFSLKYFTGIPAGDAVVDYNQVELGVRHALYNGVRGKLDFNLKGGYFLNNDHMYFMDYQHFLGNRTPLVTQDPVSTFRLMDYYLYSTNEEYFVGHFNYQFRKLLATQFTFVRMMGLRESMLVNYLATPTSENYVEVGYSIDYILRFLRLEVISSFVDGQYNDWGVRIGIVSGFDIF